MAFTLFRRQRLHPLETQSLCMTAECCETQKGRDDRREESDDTLHSKRGVQNWVLIDIKSLFDVRPAVKGR